MGDYDFLIVGSGAGGATLARELSLKGGRTAVLEMGKRVEKTGTLSDALGFFDSHKLTRMPRRSREGTILWRTIMAGGSTVVSCGNGIRCLEFELAGHGVDLSREFEEAEAEMRVAPIDENLLSRGSQVLREASESLGHTMEPMAKFIDAGRCRRCGRCVYGCPFGAKWTALEFLDEAQRSGVEVFQNTEVERVVERNGKVHGVVARTPGGPVEFSAEVVVLAAGGLGTPAILQKSRIENAGEGLFVDLFNVTYGTTDGVNLTREPSMALVDHEFHESEGFILSPFVIHSKRGRFAEAGLKGARLPSFRLLGVMTKTVDEPAGQVYPDGAVSKPVTGADRARLSRGSSMARDILIRAGAAPRSIVTTRPEGAHPGGTAAIGKVVDRDLETEIDNLFVCDASVLPKTPGLPPILTIVALAKRLAKHLSFR
jgi:choline dehydrogenase-like flavoprotein